MIFFLSFFFNFLCKKICEINIFYTFDITESSVTYPEGGTFGVAVTSVLLLHAGMFGEGFPNVDDVVVNFGAKSVMYPAALICTGSMDVGDIYFGVTKISINNLNKCR